MAERKGNPKEPHRFITRSSIPDLLPVTHTMLPLIQRGGLPDGRSASVNGIGKQKGK